MCQEAFKQILSDPRNPLGQLCAVTFAGFGINPDALPHHGIRDIAVLGDTVAHNCWTDDPTRPGTRVPRPDILNTLYCILSTEPHLSTLDAKVILARLSCVDLLISLSFFVIFKDRRTTADHLSALEQAIATKKPLVPSS